MRSSALIEFTAPSKQLVRWIMDIGEVLYVTSRGQFRTWLARHHKTEKEIWLVQYKKATGKPSIEYVEAVEEAICYGWIDGFVKNLDAERYTVRFTPRRPGSNWTDTNRDRARKMIAQGKMTASGRASLPSDMVPSSPGPKALIRLTGRRRKS